MSELIAKPIVDNQYWIVTDGNKKVGNIEANNAGYGVKINGTFLQFDSTDDLTRYTNIRFDSVTNVTSKPMHPYPEYPTTKRVYNSMLDIQRGLHLFTKTKKSKCYHAAGYFVLYQSTIPQVVFCPKYIFVQRYSYFGPYKTEIEAQNKINSLL